MTLFILLILMRCAIELGVTYALYGLTHCTQFLFFYPLLIVVHVLVGKIFNYYVDIEIRKE